MMMPIKNATLTLVLLTLCASARAADDPAAARATFTGLYAKFNAAMNTRNTTEVGAMLAPGFHGEDVGGKARSAKKLLDEIGALPDDPNRKADSTVVSATLDGETAQVAQRLLVTSSKSVFGKKILLELVSDSDDTWTRSGSAWKLLKSTTRKMAYSANGSVISEKTNPPK
jgi:hypothetical protein